MIQWKYRLLGVVEVKIRKFYARLGWILSVFLVAVTAYVSLAPETLSAAHTVRVRGINNAKIVETVLPEPATETVVRPVVAQETASRPVATVVSTVASEPVATPTVAPVSYSVTHYVTSRDEYTNTAFSLSYSQIYQFKKMIYGHNSDNLLGNLASRYVGETVMVNGVAYRVANIVKYKQTADGNLEGDPNLMRNIVYNALGHSLAMLTCAGQPNGQGGASHRLVVYLDIM